MKRKNLSFVDFGLEHITLLVCTVENKSIVDIPFLEKVQIEQPIQRPQSSLTQLENFEIMMRLIDIAERKLNINISEIIFVIKDKSIKHFAYKKKLLFKRPQKVSYMNEEKLSMQVFKDFYRQYGCEYSVVDFICHSFTIDGQTAVKNPYKLKCEQVEMFASIIAVRKIFSKMFCTYMEKYKIHTKHYISSCIGVVNLIKERLKKGNTLVVDLGSCSAEYCLLHKNVIIGIGLVNIGGFDMTRDIANVLKIHMQDAEKLKLADNELVNSGEIKNSECLDIRRIFQAREIADARLSELFDCIEKDIKNKYKKISFNRVLLCGGVARYKNTVQIAKNIFNCEVGIIDSEYIKASATVRKKVPAYFAKEENIQIIGALSFYIDNLNKYANAKRGFIFKMPSRIICFLRDLLY